MGTRRAARELALKMLFQIDVGGLPPDEVIANTLETAEADPSTEQFASALLRGTLEHQAELDGIITEYASGWALDRMASVDRNLLRLALFEILHLDDIPYSVSINEAVELAKSYSTAESGRFINGILGNFVRNGREMRRKAGGDSGGDDS